MCGMNAIEPVVKQLEELGLVSAEKLRATGGAVPPPADAPTLLAQLVEQNLLTKFQSQQVAAGRAKSLVFGSYVMLDRLPGAGPLFKARHRRVNRLVTIRPLPPTLTKDAAATGRVLREVETSGALQHAHIAAVQDIDDVSGAYYVVAELIDGSDLAALSQQRGKLPVNEACSYAAQAAAGLDQAHALGLAHRDVRAETLFVDRTGTVKVFGFGLTLPTGNADARTEAADDVAALGRVLYRLLAGIAAPTGATTSPTLREVRPDVSPGLDAYIARMTSAQPEERPTMAEAAAALKSPETLPAPSTAAAESPFAFAFDDAEAPAAAEQSPVVAPLPPTPPSFEPPPAPAATSAAEPVAVAETMPEAIVMAVTEEDEADAEEPVVAVMEPTVEPAGTFSIGPVAAVSDSMSFAAPAGSSFAAATKTATVRKPAKRVKLGPLPWEVDPKFLTPPYLIGGGAGAFVLLALLIGFFVGGSKPAKSKVIPVVPARASGAPAARPAAPPPKELFSLPPSDSLPAAAPAKPKKR
jgi:hypothetical protein